MHECNEQSLERCKTYNLIDGRNYVRKRIWWYSTKIYITMQFLKFYRINVETINWIFSIEKESSTSVSIS